MNIEYRSNIKIKTIIRRFIQMLGLPKNVRVVFLKPNGRKFSDDLTLSKLREAYNYKK